MPRLFPAAAFLLLLAACQGREQPFNTGPENTAADKDSGAALRSLAAVYADTVPCNDCQGISTRLVLKPDSLYELEETYLGRSKPTTNYRRGPWRVRGQVVTLEPSGNDPVRRYAVDADESLRLIDANGDPMESTTVDYTLDRIGDTNLSEAGTRREFTGKFTYSDGASVFVECGSEKRYGIATTNLMADLKRQYDASRKENGQPVFLRVAATLQNQQAESGSSELLMIEKILEIKPDPICPQAQKQAFQK